MTVDTIFEELLERVSSKLINLPLDKFDSTIRDAQKSLCEYFQFDRSILWLFNKEVPDKALRTHWYDPTKILTPNDYIEVNSGTSWIFNQILQEKTIVLESPQDFPQVSSEDCRFLINLGINAIIVEPLLIDGNVFGALSFCCLQKKNLPETYRKRIVLCAQIFSSAFAHRERENEVQDRLRFESPSIRSCFAGGQDSPHPPCRLRP